MKLRTLGILIAAVFILLVPFYVSQAQEKTGDCILTKSDTTSERIESITKADCEKYFNDNKTAKNYTKWDWRETTGTTGTPGPGDPPVAYDVQTAVDELIAFQTVTEAGDLEKLFTRLLKWLQYIFFVVAVVFIILTAFKYLQAQGDPAKVASAQQSLIWAAIAIVVALIAGGIRLVVQSLLKGL